MSQSEPEGSRMLSKKKKKVSFHQLEWLPGQREALKGLVSHSFINVHLLRAYDGPGTDLNTTEDQRRTKTCGSP